MKLFLLWPQSRIFLLYTSETPLKIWQTLYWTFKANLWGGWFVSEGRISLFVKGTNISVAPSLPLTYAIRARMKISNDFKLEYFLFHILCWSVIKKTLPEAQLTQGVESITWVNLSTRIVWNWFQWNFLNWLQFCHQMALLALVANFATVCTTCILIPNLTTRWRQLH